MFGVLVLLAAAQAAIVVTRLSNKDFANGTLIITQPGFYELAEDVTFDPHPLMPTPGLAPYNTPAFKAGFFAAIVIQCQDVTFDLSGFTMKQSKRHYLHQRFYAHIELGSSPFLAGQGPAMFATGPIAIAEQVIIKNGKFGLTAHHAIHGSLPVGVTLRDLRIVDWEVAGIHLNGGARVVISNVFVGNILKKVPVVGLFSAGKFIEPFVKNIVENCPGSTSVTIAGVNIAGEQVAASLKQLIDDTHEAFVVQNSLAAVPPLVANPSGLVDGGSIYGIILHTRGVAVNGLKTALLDPTVNANIELVDVTVKNIKVQTREIVALSKLGVPGVPILDAVGSVFQWLKATNNTNPENIRPVGNPIANAQLFVVKNQGCLTKTPHLNQNFDMGFKNSITPAIVDWFAGAGGAPYPWGPTIGNGDTMFHVNKGLFGLRLDAASNVRLENVKIMNLQQLGMPGSPLAAMQSPLGTLPGYTGNTAVGVGVASSKIVAHDSVKVCGVHSTSGPAYGATFRFASTSMLGDAMFSDIQGATASADTLFEPQVPSTRFLVNANPDVSCPFA